MKNTVMSFPEVYGVPVDNKVFNNYFSAYSTLPYEANNLLTNERIEGMIRLRQAYDQGLSFSFVNGKFYATIVSKTSMLDPGIYKPGKEMLLQYYKTIKYMLAIMELELTKFAGI